MHSRLRRLFATTLMMGISFIIAGLLAEVVVRLTMKDQIVLFPRYHTDVEYNGFRLRSFRPNSTFEHTSVDGVWEFRTNAQGFRSDYDYTYEKPAQLFRVLALGDSHTAGYEVGQEESYAAQLEQLLRRSGMDAEVLNTGISGFGTAEQLAFLVNDGVRYQPDVVVVGFYANDLQDNIKAGIYALEDGSLSIAKRDHAPGVRIQNMLYDFRVIRWLSENSYAFSFTFNAVYELAKNALARSASEEAITEYAIPVGDFSDYEFELAKAIMSRIAEVCDTIGAKLIIVDIPAPTREAVIVPSVKDQLRPHFSSVADALIDSRETLAPLPESGIGAHVPHGHRHISAEAHRLFARAIADSIFEFRPTNGASEPDDD